MNTDQLKGLPVISVANGERLGTVTRVYFDPQAMQVSGFAFDAGGGIFEPERTPIVDAGNVQSIGTDALILTDKESARGEHTEARYSELIEIGDLVGRSLLTADGRDEGKLAAMAFDERTFKVTHLEAAHGRFKERTTIPIDDVAMIGPDYVILTTKANADDAVAEETGGAVRVIREDASGPRISTI